MGLISQTLIAAEIDIQVYIYIHLFFLRFVRSITCIHLHYVEMCIKEGVGEGLQDPARLGLRPYLRIQKPTVLRVIR